jgi:hypothetical protein
MAKGSNGRPIKLNWKEVPSNPPRQAFGGPIKAKPYHRKSSGGKKPGFFDKLPAEHVLELGQKIGKSIRKSTSGKKKPRSPMPKTNRFAR